jgi:hypothetical protein
VTSPRADLVAAMRARYAAMTAGDTGTLAGLLHEQLVYTHSKGNRDTKQSYLGRVRGGLLGYGPIIHREEISLPADGIALVIGEMETDVTVGAASRRMRNAFLGVWILDGGRWQLLAYQPTPLPAEDIEP